MKINRTEKSLTL